MYATEHWKQIIVIIWTCHKEEDNKRLDSHPYSWIVIGYIHIYKKRGHNNVHIFQEPYCPNSSYDKNAIENLLRHKISSIDPYNCSDVTK
jgi:hypothetical protein